MAHNQQRDEWTEEKAKQMVETNYPSRLWDGYSPDEVAVFQQIAKGVLIGIEIERKKYLEAFKKLKFEGDALFAESREENERLRAALEQLRAEKDKEIASLKQQIALYQQGVTLTFDERGKFEMRNHQLEEAWKELEAERLRAERVVAAAESLMKMNGKMYAHDDGQANIPTFIELNENLHRLKVALATYRANTGNEAKEQKEKQ